MVQRYGVGDAVEIRFDPDKASDSKDPSGVGHWGFCDDRQIRPAYLGIRCIYSLWAARRKTQSPTIGTARGTGLTVVNRREPHRSNGYIAVLSFGVGRTLWPFGIPRARHLFPAIAPPAPMKPVINESGSASTISNSALGPMWPITKPYLKPVLFRGAHSKIVQASLFPRSPKVSAGLGGSQRTGAGILAKPEGVSSNTVPYPSLDIVPPYSVAIAITEISSNCTPAPTPAAVATRAYMLSWWLRW
jgi:hypothetical protein